MRSTAIDDVVETVRKRGSLIERLDGEPLDRRALNREMDISRSTVYRALDELASSQLLRQDEGKYQTTPFGALVNREYQRFVDTVEALHELRKAVGILPPAKFFDPIVLVDAEIKAATKQVPDKPLLCLQELLADTSSVRVTTPTHSWQVFGLLNERLEDGMSVEVILDESNVESRVTEVLDHARCTTIHRAIQPPFVLVLVDEPETEMGVVIVDEIGRPEAMIRNRTGAATDWADSLFRECTTDE